MIIEKRRWCEDCVKNNRQATAMRYAGCQKISDRMTIVAYECDHGHHAGDTMRAAEAQSIVTELAPALRKKPRNGV